MQVFPSYRKYANGQSVFKITAEDRFEECQKLGSRVLHHEKIAEIYPDKLLIKDMLVCHAGRWEESNEMEWMNLFKETLG